MALNIKLAMLLSLGFIGVMCWLVNQVARPNGTPAGAGTLVMYTSNNADTSKNVDLDQPIGAQLANRFEQPTPARPERESAEASGDAVGGGLVHAEPDTSNDVALPPRLGAASEISLAERTSQTPVAPNPTGRRAPTLPAGARDRTADVGGVDASKAQYADAEATVKPDLNVNKPDLNVNVPPRVTEATNPGIAEAGGAIGAQQMRPASPEPQPRPLQPLPERTARATRYKAQRNDNLYKIARQHWGAATPRDVRLIMDANPNLKKRSGKVLLGETLIIPSRETGIEVAAADAPKKATVAPAGQKGRAEGARGAPQAKPAANRPTANADAKAKSKTQRDEPAAMKAPRVTTAETKPRAAEKDGRSRGSSKKDKSRAPAAATRAYRVRAGDSLAKIAERELKDRSRWREILALNRLANADRLLAGATLRLPQASDG